MRTHMFTNDERPLITGFEAHIRTYDDYVMIGVKVDEYNQVL